MNKTEARQFLTDLHEASHDNVNAQILELYFVNYIEHYPD